MSEATSPTRVSVYDALGNRVAEKVNDVWQFVIYDAFGKLVAEYGGTRAESTFLGSAGAAHVLQVADGDGQHSPERRPERRGSPGTLTDETRLAEGERQLFRLFRPDIRSACCSPSASETRIAPIPGMRALPAAPPRAMLFVAVGDKKPSR
ncbi:MAG: hypothetical protein IPJ30_10735 [Acidobacteria bacterium]|nr:hypothetical protein [Acidobacteriota bacterium]